MFFYWQKFISPLTSYRRFNGSPLFAFEDRETFDLSVKNPNAPEEDPLREPGKILAEISTLDAESAEILESISGML